VVIIIIYIIIIIIIIKGPITCKVVTIISDVAMSKLETQATPWKILVTPPQKNKIKSMVDFGLVQFISNNNHTVCNSSEICELINMLINKINKINK